MIIGGFCSESFEGEHHTASNINRMSDSRQGDRAAAPSIQPVVVVSEGIGKTANIEGAKAKEVFNVSKHQC